MFSHLNPLSSKQKCIELLPSDWLISNLCYQAIEQMYLIKLPVCVCVYCVCIYIYIYIYTVLSVNEYTPFEKYNFKQYLNEHKNHFQNVDKTKFNITSV